MAPYAYQRAENFKKKREFPFVLFTHAQFRAMLKREGVDVPHFNLPLWPYTSILVASFLIAVIVILVSVADTRTPVLIGLLLLLGISACYRLFKAPNTTS